MNISYESRSGRPDESLDDFPPAPTYFGDRVQQDEPANIPLLDYQSPIAGATTPQSRRYTKDSSYTSKILGGRSATADPNANYDYTKVRRNLLWGAFGRWIMTVALCGLIVFALKGFETSFHKNGKKYSMSAAANKWYNTVMLGLSLLLSLNIASSLKRYAKTLRWTILNRSFFSMETFDLILGCEGQTDVFKLMLRCFPGRKKKDQNAFWIWTVCVLWLLTNVGAQILVASLSIFWPVDAAPSGAPHLGYGHVAVSDLTGWTYSAVQCPTCTNPAGDGLQIAAANGYGLASESYPTMNISYFDYNDDNDVGPDDLLAYAGTRFASGNGNFIYRFWDWNSDDYSAGRKSKRTISSRANCTTWKINKRVNSTWINAQSDTAAARDVWIGAGNNCSTSYMSDYKNGCGPRCTKVWVFQNAACNFPTRVMNDNFFECDSFMGSVTNTTAEYKFSNDTEIQKVVLQDQNARVAAGSIAGTGYFEDGTGYNYHMYTLGSYWSPNATLSGAYAASYIALFSIGAVASYDAYGQQYNLTLPQDLQPQKGLQVDVNWLWIGILLGGICGIQLIALLCLYLFGRKVFWRDDSHFSLAMLLMPVVERIGHGGANLTGKEIVDHERLRRHKIAYGYRRGELHDYVSVLWDNSDQLSRSRSSWRKFRGQSVQGTPTQTP